MVEIWCLFTCLSLLDVFLVFIVYALLPHAFILLISTFHFLPFPFSLISCGLLILSFSPEFTFI